jgi:hypothetical protein
MRKVLEDGLTVCSPCGDGLDGAIIDFEAERNEEEPDCDMCLAKGRIVMTDEQIPYVPTPLDKYREILAKSKNQDDAGA